MKNPPGSGGGSDLDLCLLRESNKSPITIARYVVLFFLCHSIPCKLLISGFEVGSIPITHPIEPITLPASFCPSLL